MMITERLAQRDGGNVVGTLDFRFSGRFLENDPDGIHRDRLDFLSDIGGMALKEINVFRMFFPKSIQDIQAFVIEKYLAGFTGQLTINFKIGLDLLKFFRAELFPFQILPLQIQKELRTDSGIQRNIRHAA